MANNKKKSWTSPVGYWEVTTEGDCEGKSIRCLGIFHGNYADIAFALADKSYYALRFRRIWDEDMTLPLEKKADKVSIMFDDASFFSDKTEMQKEINQAIGDKAIVTTEGYGQAMLYSPDREEFLRRKAIEKLQKTLTTEEMEALGIYIA